jgi:hypothetical protein
MASQYIALNYPGHPIGGGWGDPAGVARGYQDDTAFDLLNEYFSLSPWKTKWRPAPSNDWLMRKEAVKHTLNRLVDGLPGFQLSPKCKMLRKGFSGGYHYKFFKAGNKDQVQEMPNKNMFSHPMDGLQYLILGGGEHNVVLRKDTKRRERGNIVVAKGINYNVFSRNSWKNTKGV